MTIVIGLLILASVPLYLMTPEERGQFGRFMLEATRRAILAATRGLPPGEPFNDLLRGRTRFAVVTPLLVTLNAAVFVLMAFEPGAVGDAQTLVHWGGSIPLRTTNGEWWRLFAATFVHTGMLHLLATMAGLVPVALIVERAAGPVAFAATYVMAGVVGGVVSLWTTSAMTLSAGASAAIFGIYGLLLAAVAWCLVDRFVVSIPLVTLKQGGAAAGFFILYSLTTDALGTGSELAGLAAGFGCGLVTTRDVAFGKPSLPRAVLVTAATVLVAALSAIPLRGIADVAPEIARVVGVEERTTGAYDAAIVSFRKRRITSAALATLIEQMIVPELQAAHTRLKALRGVPPEHVPLVAAAEEYVQLREQSWRRRAEGLLQSNMRMLREAEETERAALEAFRRLRAAG